MKLKILLKRFNFTKGYDNFIGRENISVQKSEKLVNFTKIKFSENEDLVN